jgi:predicted transcriptional regulator of viral defense system
MTKAGTLERVGPGRYRLARSTGTNEHHDLTVAAAAVARSVVCLISALHFHDVGTQLPAEVWIAVPRGTRVPQTISRPVAGAVRSSETAWIWLGGNHGSE